MARRKFSDYQIEQSIYVVGAEQILHFRQVFATLIHMGMSQAKDCFHLSYGLVRLPEGKMSSRDGSAISFSSLKTSIEAELTKVMATSEADTEASDITK